MMSVVVAMSLVLAIVAGVVVAVLIEMKSRSWRWAPKMARIARQTVRYLRRHLRRYAAQYLNREASGLPQ
jgi:type II secretory pathway component PulJ